MSRQRKITCKRMGVSTRSAPFFGRSQVIHIECTVSKYHQGFLHGVSKQLGFETKRMGFL